MRNRFVLLAVICLLGAAPVWAQRSGRVRDRGAVRVVAPDRVAVGAWLLPVYVSQDWSKTLPGVTRAVLVLHGVLRNADVYYRTALQAQGAAGPAGAGSLMIAPQFLEQPDIEANDLGPNTLRWAHDAWEGGADAIGPAPASSYDALDTILRVLADRSRFPNLRTVVVAGHSGGAQVVQRYAIAGQAGPALEAAGIAVRYVVANPSSYAYFDAQRPLPPAPGACPRFDDWKYGMADRPRYLATPSPQALLDDYARRDVEYLLGTLDTDPNHPALDRSCMAETQGAYRLARGHAYYDRLRAIAGPALRHRLVEVPGVGHSGPGMFTAPAGVAALFAGPSP